jgi:hypothetical protein
LLPLPADEAGNPGLTPDDEAPELHAAAADLAILAAIIECATMRVSMYQFFMRSVAASLRAAEHFILMDKALYEQ